MSELSFSVTNGYLYHTTTAGECEAKTVNEIAELPTFKTHFSGLLVKQRTALKRSEHRSSAINLM
jgi:hypothetical protein